VVQGKCITRKAEVKGLWVVLGGAPPGWWLTSCQRFLDCILSQKRTEVRNKVLYRF
jgi:hypothetical protein